MAIANNAVITLGAEAANARTVGIQLQTAVHNNLNEPAVVVAYLSSDAAGLAPVNAAGTDIVPTDSGDGAIIDTAVAATHASVRLVSDATGSIELTLTNAGDETETVYLNVVLGNGKLVTSGAIAFVDDTP